MSHCHHHTHLHHLVCLVGLTTEIILNILQGMFVKCCMFQISVALGKSCVVDFSGGKTCGDFSGGKSSRVGGDFYVGKSCCVGGGFSGSKSCHVGGDFRRGKSCHVSGW